MRKINESLRMLSELQEQQPDDAEVAWDLAITQLQLGEYSKGFKGYEARWRLAYALGFTRAAFGWHAEATARRAAVACPAIRA